MSKVPDQHHGVRLEHDRYADAKDFEDLTAVRTPGCRSHEYPDLRRSAITNIQIRGISSRTSEPTTGMYLDDVPFTTIGNNTNIGGSVALPVVFDLNRVEVLRGPQGTLFGSTSEGGAIRLIPNAPSLTELQPVRAHGVRQHRGRRRHGYDVGYAIGGPINDDKLGFRVQQVVPRGRRLDRPLSAGGEAAGLPVRHRDEREFDEPRPPRVRAAVEAERPPSRSSRRSDADRRGNDPTGYETARSRIPSTASGTRITRRTSGPTIELTVGSVRLEWQLKKLVLTSVTSLVTRYYNFHADYTAVPGQGLLRQSVPAHRAARRLRLRLVRHPSARPHEEFRVASDTGGRWNWVTGIFLSDQKQYDFAHVIHPNLPAFVLANFGKPIDQVLGVPFYQGQWVAFNDVNTHSQGSRGVR